MALIGTFDGVDKGCVILLALCVVLWTAISTMGESLGAATQLLGYLFGIYLTVLTGGVFVRNPILSLILGDSRKDNNQARKHSGRDLAARLMLLQIIIVVMLTVTSGLSAAISSPKTPQQRAAEMVRHNNTVETQLLVADIRTGVDNGTLVLPPFVLFAGFSSSTLVTREGHAVWGVLPAVPSILFRQDEWLNAFTLSPNDHLLTPKGGQDAVDYVFGLGLWRKLSTNLRGCGYNSTNFHASVYDFRPGPDDERLAGHFKELKTRIEEMVNRTGQPAVILSHSYGDTLVRWFYKWVQSEQGGRGGSDWVNRHIGYDYSQGAVTAGTPKALLAMITGQAAEFHVGDRSFLNFMPLLKRDRRAEMFRSFGSVASSVPSGGNLLWGQDGTQEIITFAADYDKEGNLKTNNIPRGDFASIFQPLKEVSPPGYGLAMKTFKGALTPDLLNGSSLHKELWTNIMSSQLPNAPNLHKIVVYGRGKATEVGYVLKKEGEGYALDTSVHFPEKGIHHGIRYDDGDGTVPLVSLGMGCAYLWHQEAYNPGGVKVTCRELTSKEDFFTPTDHVFSANPSTILDVLKIVSGKGHEVSGKDIFSSDIEHRAEILDKRMATGDFTVPDFMSEPPTTMPNETPGASPPVLPTAAKNMSYVKAPTPTPAPTLASPADTMENPSLALMHGGAPAPTPNTTGRVYGKTQPEASPAPSTLPSAPTPSHRPLPLPTASTPTKRATQAGARKDPALLEAALARIREIMKKGRVSSATHPDAAEGATVQANGSSQQQPKQALHPELVDALRHAIAVMKADGVAMPPATPRPTPSSLLRDVARPTATATQEGHTGNEASST